jgi:hypothetical protein
MYRHRNAVWIKAYWDGQDERWASSPGRSEQQTDQTVRWVNGYEGEGRAWRYPPAHMSNQRLGEGDGQRWRDESRSRRNRQ